MPHDWLKQALAKAEKSKSDLARELEIDPARVTEIFNGTRQIQIPEIPKIARFLSVPFMDVWNGAAGEQGADTELTKRADAITIFRRGYVEAGRWSETIELPNDEWLEIPVSAQYARFNNVFAVGVRGKSMNKVFSPGDTLICVPYFDYPYDLVSRVYVIVYRRGHNGLFEATVKQLEISSDGSYWLCPQSTEPKYQQPWQIPPIAEWVENEIGAGHDDIFINAVVISSIQDHLIA